MRTNSRRATVIWLIITGVLAATALLFGGLAPAVQAAIFTGYLIMLLAGLGIFNWPEVRRRLPSLPRLDREALQRQARARSASSAAKTAADRARTTTPAYRYEDGLDLLDIGVIISEVGSGGMHLRRGDATLDDQGLQPYLVVHTPPERANQTVTVRYEVLDPSGAVQFMREDEVYLRDGQNNLLATHRLPLRANAAALVPGLWELHVRVEDRMVGMHTFGVGPSTAERARMFRGETAADRQRRDRLAEQPGAEDDSPISLEDLLRDHQSGQQ